jgi:hypothetical protein
LVSIVAGTLRDNRRKGLNLSNELDAIILAVYVQNIFYQRGILPMKRTNIYLGDVQHKRLKAIGKRKGLKVSEIIRRMIDQGFKKYEKK